MNTQQVLATPAATNQGPTPWAYVIVSGTTQARGIVQAIDARDALSRTLTTDNGEGVMYGTALSISPDVIQAAPANATAEHVLEIPNGTLMVKKVTATLNERLSQMNDYLRDEHRLKQNIDYAYTLKYGKLNILCDAVYEERIREACDKHHVEVASAHTYN